MYINPFANVLRFDLHVYYILISNISTTGIFQLTLMNVTGGGVTERSRSVSFLTTMSSRRVLNAFKSVKVLYSLTFSDFVLQLGPITTCDRTGPDATAVPHRERLYWSV